MDIPEDDLHALVDGRLPPEAAAALQARVDGDPEAAATVAAWRSQREALRQVHRGVLDEPLPAGLAAAAQRATALHHRGSQWWRWGGMAASVALAFALGWLAHAQWPGVPSTLASNGTARGFAHQAAVAHVVYMPEVRHP